MQHPTEPLAVRRYKPCFWPLLLFCKRLLCAVHVQGGVERGIFGMSRAWRTSEAPATPTQCTIMFIYLPGILVCISQWNEPIKRVPLRTDLGALNRVSVCCSPRVPLFGTDWGHKHGAFVCCSLTFLLPRGHGLYIQ